MINKRHNNTSSKLNRHKFSEFQLLSNNYESIELVQNNDNENKIESSIKNTKRIQSAPIVRKQKSLSFDKQKPSLHKYSTFENDACSRASKHPQIKRENTHTSTATVSSAITTTSHSSGGDNDKEHIRRAIFKQYINVFNETADTLRHTRLTIEDKKQTNVELQELTEKFNKDNEFYKNFMDKKSFVRKKLPIVKKREFFRPITPLAQSSLISLTSTFAHTSTNSNLNINNNNPVNPIVVTDTAKVVETATPKPDESVKPNHAKGKTKTPKAVRSQNNEMESIKKVQQINSTFKAKALSFDQALLGINDDEIDQVTANYALNESFDLEIQNIEKKSAADEEKPTKIWTVQQLDKNTAEQIAADALISTLEKNDEKFYNKNVKNFMKNTEQALKSIYNYSREATSRLDKRIAKPELPEFHELDLNELNYPTKLKFHSIHSLLHSGDDSDNSDEQIKNSYVGVYRTNLRKREDYMRLIRCMYHRSIINEKQMEKIINRGIKKHILDETPKQQPFSLERSRTTIEERKRSFRAKKSPHLSKTICGGEPMIQPPAVNNGHVLLTKQDDLHSVHVLTNTSFDVEYAQTECLTLEHLRSILKSPQAEAKLRPKTVSTLKYLRSRHGLAI